VLLVTPLCAAISIGRTSEAMMTSTTPSAELVSLDAIDEKQVNYAIGRRLRRRRRLMGMTQTELAKQLGVQFQQVQKYECSAARISASRLYKVAAALKAPIDYFFDSLPPVGASSDEKTEASSEAMAELLSEKETLNFLGCYARLPASVRRRLRTFATSLGEALVNPPASSDTSPA
jgi:transcriptional regulator with XRE-family HTH domain